MFIYTPFTDLDAWQLVLLLIASLGLATASGWLARVMRPVVDNLPPPGEDFAQALENGQQVLSWAGAFAGAVMAAGVAIASALDLLYVWGVL